MPLTLPLRLGLCASRSSVSSVARSMPACNSSDSSPPAAAAPRTAPDLKAGAAVYQQDCSGCHASGLAGAPAFGDRKAWKARIAQGLPTLVDHAVNGYQGTAGVMPAKGGHSELSAAQVRNAVAYMIEKSR